MSDDPVRQKVLYDALAEHIIRHFYHPDLEALRIVFAAIHAHYSEGDPVWIFVVGPPGSGKTAIAINCISELPEVTVESSITPRSFLAGKASRSASTLLNRKSLIIAFKDFTTMVSKREEDQREIVSNLREIYDGKFKHRTAEACRPWEGKCTVIAAATPAIERTWAIHRDLGERFMQVRWENTKHPTEAARMARAQTGQEREIAKMMRAHTKDLFQSISDGPAHFPDKYGDRVDAAATLVAQLRRKVIRESTGNRQIIDTSPAEEPTRLAKTISQIAMHHAPIFGREEVTDADLRAGIRTALDTVPAARLAIIGNLFGTMTETDIRSLCELHPNTISWQTDELEALGAIEVGRRIDGIRTITCTSPFLDLSTAARLW